MAFRISLTPPELNGKFFSQLESAHCKISQLDLSYYSYAQAAKPPLDLSNMEKLGISIQKNRSVVAINLSNVLDTPEFENDKNAKRGFNAILNIISQCRKLKELSLAGLVVTKAGGSFLIKVLQAADNLERLDLSFARFEDMTQVMAIAKMLKNKASLQIDLSSSPKLADGLIRSHKDISLMILYHKLKNRDGSPRLMLDKVTLQLLRQEKKEEDFSPPKLRGETFFSGAVVSPAPRMPLANTKDEKDEKDEKDLSDEKGFPIFFTGRPSSPLFANQKPIKKDLLESKISQRYGVVSKRQ